MKDMARVDNVNEFERRLLFLLEERFGGDDGVLLGYDVKDMVSSVKKAMLGDELCNSSEKCIYEFRSFADKVAFDISIIAYVNPNDLSILDMDELPYNTYFIGLPAVERGKVYVVSDIELKRSLYDYSQNNPDIVFRGKKFF